MTELTVAGGDAELAASARLHRGELIRFEPDGTSDLARAIGLARSSSGHDTITIDALELAADDWAVNMVVVGRAPDRLRRVHRRVGCGVEVDGRSMWRGPATGVIVANGEFLHGRDVVPRGHPGDGHLEVHVHALGPGQRALMRERLASGTHLPHPGIATARGTRAVVRFDRPVSLEVDGRRRPAVTTISVALVPGAFTLAL